MYAAIFLCDNYTTIAQYGTQKESNSLILNKMITVIIVIT